jgi:hypothetical protein
MVNRRVYFSCLNTTFLDKLEIEREREIYSQTRFLSRVCAPLSLIYDLSFHKLHMCSQFGSERRASAHVCRPGVRQHDLSIKNYKKQHDITFTLHDAVVMCVMESK